jgi:hypothetical protein
MKLADQTLSRFNGLLLPCFFTHESPALLDLYGLRNFADKFFEKNGSLENRREQLHNALAQLNRNIDRESVYYALLNAKQEKMRAYLEGYRIDSRRNFFEGRKRVSRILRDTVLRQFLIDCGVKVVFSELSEAIRRKWPGPPGRPRRSRAGHQPEPWLKVVRKKLAQAKVPKAIGEDLLVAVGLIPDRQKIGCF